MTKTEFAPFTRVAADLLIALKLGVLLVMSASVARARGLWVTVRSAPRALRIQIVVVRTITASVTPMVLSIAEPNAREIRTAQAVPSVVRVSAEADVSA